MFALAVTAALLGLGPLGSAPARRPVAYALLAGLAAFLVDVYLYRRSSGLCNRGYTQSRTGCGGGAVKVLVVEDEPRMADLLRRALVEEGYAVDLAGAGDTGYGYAVAGAYDAIVLDVLLPRCSGFDVCTRLRRHGVWTPVLMLTARDAVTDRIRGLDGGADDYLTKPFDLAELFARIRALARRGGVPRPTVLRAGELTLDPATRQVCRGSAAISLTAKEFALLEAFLRHPGMVLSRETLLRRCWDFAHVTGSNVVDVHIRSLREKVDRPFQVASVETVRGAGYRLRSDGGRPLPSLPEQRRQVLAAPRR